MTVDDLHETDAPERRCSELASRRLEVGAIVRERSTHVVEQQVGVGMNPSDSTPPARREARPSSSSEMWQPSHPTTWNSCLAPPDLGIVEVAPRRHAERLRVERDVGNRLVADFRRVVFASGELALAILSSGNATT